MKTIKIAIITPILLAANLYSQPISHTVLTKDEAKIVGAGLTFILYPLQPSQATATNDNGYIAYDELIKQKPLRAPKTIYSISLWEKGLDQNGIVMGYLKIDKAGTYAFRTYSDYDRNELLVNGTILCKFKDGENKGQTIDLTKGYVPGLCT